MLIAIDHGNYNIKTPPKIVYFRCCGYHYYEGNFNYFE